MILTTEERATGKKIVITLSLAIMLLALCFVLSGCMKQVKTDGKPLMFLEYQSFGIGSVLVDRDTHVMYWMSEGKSNHGNLTLLVNPDGSPKVWEGDLQ